MQVCFVTKYVLFTDQMMIPATNAMENKLNQYLGK
jgi:hypothetical protein